MELSRYAKFCNSQEDYNKLQRLVNAHSKANESVKVNIDISEKELEKELKKVKDKIEKSLDKVFK